MRVSSAMIPIGTSMPAFELTDVVSKQTVRHASDGRPTLVMFICNHCPFVVHIMAELDRLGRDLADDVRIIAINSNDATTHPQDGPANMAALAKDRGWAFPFCFDETQEVARAFSAACTPDIFLFDGDNRLFYRGQLDGSRPGSGVSDGKDLRAAVAALLAGEAPPELQVPSMGCNIKWRS